MQIQVVAVVNSSFMDKKERMEFVYKGITVLRAQYEPRKNCWKIVKATRNSGWTHFGTGWYITAGDAEFKINQIVSRDPDKFKKD